MQQTRDGGYVLAGFTTPEGTNRTDAWVLKLDTEGRLLWERRLGGAFDDGALCIQQTRDGGYVLAAYVESVDNWDEFECERNEDSIGNDYEDAWLFKLDSQGRVTWKADLSEPCEDRALCVQQTRDGGYILAGYAAGRIEPQEHPGVAKVDANRDHPWVTKLRPDAKPIWAKNFSRVRDGRAVSVRQIRNRGYIVAGFAKTKGTGSQHAWVFKLDPTGKVLWERTFGGSRDDKALSVRETRDGGYVVAGVTSSKGAGGQDAWVLKLDPGGKILWERTFGGSGEDGAACVQQTRDGGYVVAGFTSSKGAGNEDAWVFGLDASGRVVWERTFGGSRNDKALSVRETTDGGYIVAGVTSSKGAGGQDAWVLRLGAKPTRPLGR